MVVVTAKDITPQDQMRLEGNVRKIFHKATFTREELVGEIRSAMDAPGAARRGGLGRGHAPLRRVVAPSLALAACGLAGCAGQCGARGGLPPPRPPTVKGPDGQKYHLVDKGPYKAFYDRWGRLQRIEYDSNGDGRPDHVARHDGPHRAPTRWTWTLDFDGRTDRWERYDDEGRLLKVGTARGAGTRARPLGRSYRPRRHAGAPRARRGRRRRDRAGGGPRRGAS